MRHNNRVKKLISIVLVIIFLFSVVGYYGIYMAMLRQANIAIAHQIDNDDYGVDQTFTIKIPLTLPYPIQQDEFQNLQGDFEHRGEFYKLVKQKYLNDTLYVVCLRNIDKKKAFKVFSDFVKLSTDQTSSSNNQSTKTILNFIKDFNSLTSRIEYSDRVGIDLKLPFPLLKPRILSWYKVINSPPPEVNC